MAGGAWQLGPIVRSLRHHKGAFSLLVLEVAFGMVILVHAFVMGGFYLRLRVTEPGITDGELVVVRRTFLRPRPLEEARAQARADLAALAGLRATVGVRAVALFDGPPMPETVPFPPALEGMGPGGRVAAAWPVRAGAEAAEVLGLRLLHGRGLGAAEPGAEPSLVVTQALAERLFGPGGAARAVGRQVRVTADQVGRVVGVVADYRYHGNWVPDATSQVLVGAEPVSEHAAMYLVRAPAARRADVARAALAALTADASSAVSAAPLERANARFSRLSTGALVVLSWTGFLVVAVALAGSLALSSFSVAERTRQIGVRRALGATRREIVAYFLVENTILTGAGVGLGLLLSVAFNIVVRNLISELTLTPGAIFYPAVTFLLAGLLSALVPARRAAAIPPWAATRTL